ncbi:MAG: molybdopterin molybdotransferase MoeA [Myxococcales bacterium]|nr:molybdopterin molybdotransferase MoeA [Myxococcales bacterium]
MRDVRMKGFAERADVEEVEGFLTRHGRVLAAESVELLASAGRVLAEDVRAEVDVPGFPRASMDGYAVRGEDTFGASAYDPIALEIVGRALPGHPFSGSIGAGEAARIMTGAPLPEGADAVVMAEVCAERGARVEVGEPVAPRKNVGAVGEDVAVGEVVLRRGRRLRPQDAGLLASIGVARVRCVRRPRVALVITGDELLPAGCRPDGARIVDSNSVVLRALVARDGGELLPFGILPDLADRVRDALREAAEAADVILVSGGSSVGEEDHAPRLVSELGTLDFHGLAMRPSSPAGVGRIAQCFVFLLPGNPVSCLCAYEFFAGPVLRTLGGRSRAWPHRRVRLPLARKISSAIGRTDYVRVAVEQGRVMPIATSGASILASTVRAAGCVIVPRGLEGMPEGAEVEVRLYDEEATAEDGS